MTSSYRSFPSHPSRSQRGQSLVEFALVIALLLFVVAGVLDLGRVFHSTVVITNAAREGTRYLTRHPDDLGSGYTGTVNAAVGEASGSMIQLTSANVSPFCPNDGSGACRKGYDAVVTVSYTFEPIMGWILPDQIPLTRSVTMVVP